MFRASVLIAAAAAVAALGLFIIVTDAPAYAGDAPETCNNCHVMHEQYENWYHGGHQRSAKCSDCHLPHDSTMEYYVEKSRQGMKDTWAFTSGRIPVSIRASEQSRAIIQENCIRCHEPAVSELISGAPPYVRPCWECHRHTAHADRGISTSPNQDALLYPIE